MQIRMHQIKDTIAALEKLMIAQLKTDLDKFINADFCAKKRFYIDNMVQSLLNLKELNENENTLPYIYQETFDNTDAKVLISEKT